MLTFNRKYINTKKMTPIKQYCKIFKAGIGATGITSVLFNFTAGTLNKYLDNNLGRATHAPHARLTD